MKISDLPLLYLSGSIAEFHVHVPKEYLSTLIREHKKLRNVRNTAAAILWDTRKKRRDILLYSRQQAAMDQEREIVELRALLKQDTQNAVSEAIKWLVDEQELEQQIFSNLQSKAIGWAVQTLQEWGCELDWNRLITIRIAELMRQSAFTRDVLLYVHPDNIESITAELPDACVLDVVGDSKISHHQAMLKSPLMCIDIDLDKQFLQLLEQFVPRLIKEEGAQ